MPQCHSTNSLIAELNLSEPLPDGSIVITDHQTAGRGQRGNSWEAEPSMNLTFSIFLKPSFLLVKDQFLLNVFTSLAIHDLLVDKTNAVVKIKWPNDILVDGKKVCGILTENQIRGTQVSNTIIGIGLNINQKRFNTPTATSLSLSCSRDFNLPEIFEELIQRLEYRYLQLPHQASPILKAAYLQHLYWYDEVHMFKARGEEFEGRIKGIGEAGLLWIETLTGDRYFDVKEIVYVN